MVGEERTSPLYERVGWPREWISIELSNKGLRRWIEGPAKEGLLREHVGGVASYCSDLAFSHYLLDEIKEARQYAVQLLDATDEYFFGDWRDRAKPRDIEPGESNRDYWHRHAVWRDKFREPCMWASCLGAWDRCRRWAAYLRDDVTFDVEQSAEDRAWYLIVAGVLLDRPWADMKPFVETIESGRRKREKLLLDTMRPLTAGDNAAFNDALAKHLSHYKSTDAKKRNMYERLAIDGTFLINLARHRGLEPRIPDRVKDHIVDLNR